MTERETDRVRGSFLGSAAGDALGYPVEFLPWASIRKTYGPEGIRTYRPDPRTGTAVISDDTQMCLFTANGILLAETDRRLKGIPSPLDETVYRAYLEWLRTQEDGPVEPHRCWVYEIPELHRTRAPGNTCLAALESGRMGTMAFPLNSSKGCGGVMRVAPLALHSGTGNDASLRELDREGAALAAITHGHPLGYIPAAILTHVLSLCVFGNGTLREAVEDARRVFREIFDAPALVRETDRMDSLILRAETLSEKSGSDAEQIRELGEGWTGEETLAIALYCALRYPEDFSAGIRASVNHSGDSDSTGAVTGQILGACVGYEAMEEIWKENLERKDVLLEMAEDLCLGCPGEGEERTGAWKRKYCLG